MVEKQEQVIWNVLLTDVEFGFDGNMYVSDWVNGWGMTGKAASIGWPPVKRTPLRTGSKNCSPKASEN